MTIFQILVDVEETAVGPFLRIINRMPGVANFHLDLDKVPAKRGAKLGKRNGAGPEIEGTAERVPQRQIVIAELMSGPKNLQYLGEKTAAHGHSPNSLHGTLNTLRKQRITETAGTGLHKLTEEAMDTMRKMQDKPQAQSIDQGAPALPAPKRKRTRKSSGGPSTVDTIMLKMLEMGGHAPRLTLRDYIVEKGFSAGAVDGALNRIKRDDFARISSPGVWDLTAKGKKHAAKLQPTTEEVAHG